jgi:hypothetical protein
VCGSSSVSSLIASDAHFSLYLWVSRRRDVVNMRGGTEDSLFRHDWANNALLGYGNIVNNRFNAYEVLNKWRPWMPDVDTAQMVVEKSPPNMDRCEVCMYACLLVCV